MSNSNRVEFRRLLQTRSVLFSCEGTAEAVIIDRLVGDERTIVPAPNVVRDNDGRPYTTLRKMKDLQDQYLGVGYPNDLLIIRIVDVNPGSIVIPKLYRKQVELRDVITRPEIEALVLAREGAYEDWYRHGKSILKPSEWCEQKLGFGKKLKTRKFLQQYWESADVVVNAIRTYDQLLGSHGREQLNLSDLLA